VPAQLEGQRVRCPSCGQVVALPGAQAPPERWFYARAKQKVGPLSWADLQKAARAGQLTPGDMVLRDGTGRWAPAQDVPNLFPPLASPVEAVSAKPFENLPLSPSPRKTKAAWWPIVQDKARTYWKIFQGWPRPRQLSAGAGGAVCLLFLLWLVWLRSAPVAPRPHLVQPAANSHGSNNADEPKTKEQGEEKKPAVPVNLAESLVRELNEIRRGAGLRPVSLNADLSQGCQAHAQYLILNPEVEGSAAWDEEKGHTGYSPEGKQAAQVSLVFFAEPQQALQEALARFLHRIRLLDAELSTIGLGIARNADGKWATVLDALRGREEVALLFPADQQQDVPLHFSGGPEIPGPTNKQNAGFPITVTFPPSREISKVQALLTEKEELVPCFVSSPEKSASPRTQRNSVCLIPKNPLKPNTLYQVKVAGQIKGKAWGRTWRFTTGDDLDEKGEWAKKALAKVNEFRQAAGLEPVVLDEDLNRGCRHHAHYLVVNHDHPATQGLGAHEEDAKLPGFTEEGQRAGKAGNIALGEFDPLASIDGWMATLYHRVPILDPRLKRIGFCCARGPRLGWITVLDVLTGREAGLLPAPLTYPAEDQKNIPLSFPAGGEVPDPIPEDKDGRAGYPITVTFPTGKVPVNITGNLKDDKDQEVPVWFSSPKKPANPKFVQHQGNTVCLIPMDPLRPSTSYRVQLQGELDGQAWSKTWSFTTGAKGSDPEQMAKEVVERINHYRTQAGLLPVTLDPATSKACQAHANYLVLNTALRGTKQFTPNDEDASLPGFTPEGQQAARRTDVFFNAPAPLVQIESIITGFYRRTFLLDPGLLRVGYGCAIDVGNGWVCVLDLNTGREEFAPTLYPLPSQANVPLAGLDRVPKSAPDDEAGFPITVTFPSPLVVRDAQAVLMAGNTTLDIYISAPDRPLDKNLQGNTICILPQQPLQAGTIYQVNVSARVNGQPWERSWRFSTKEAP
jgi:uncharacterized protein YkwD